MKLKKIVSCFVIFLIAFSICVFASEDGAYIKVDSVNSETGVVTVSGNIGVGKARNIFLIVCQKAVDISNITDGSIAQDVDFVTQIMTIENGSFSLSLKKDGAGWEEMTDYVVHVRGAMSDGTEFKFISSSLEQTVLDAISGLSADDFEEMILSDGAFVSGHSLNEYLGIELGDYISLENKGVINEVIVSSTYSNLIELKSDFESKVKVQKKFESDYRLYDDALKELKSATPQTFDTMINKHSSLFAINTSDKYGYAFLKGRYDVGRNDGFENLIEAIKKIDEPMKASEKIADAIILSVIKSAESTQLEDVLNHYTLTCGLDFTKYNKLTQVQKNKALATFKEKEVSKLEDVKNAFDKAVAENENSYSGNSGNKNSSGGSYKVPLTPTQTVSNDEINFFDVPPSHWAADMINHLSNKKIINGYDDLTFKPEANISREEFVKIVVVAFGLLDRTAQCEFSDVVPDDWFYPYIASAKSKGIVQGNNNTFGSGSFITRQDASVILYRVAEQMSMNKDESWDDGYIDWDNISDYAKSAVVSLSELGVINGYPDGAFRPNGNITRAEAACLIYKMMR